MEKNTFKVEYDSQPIFVIDDINAILKESFGIQIECISPDDSETLEYKISRIEIMKKDDKVFY